MVSQSQAPQSQRYQTKEHAAVIFFHISLLKFFHNYEGVFTSAFQPATGLHNNIALDNMAQLTRPNPDPFYEDNPSDSYDDPQEEEYHDYLRECVTQSRCHQYAC